MIKDSYPAYSSVAVDIANDEVVMTDEATFQILAYNRLENTPPTAKRSEPKRMIGGPNVLLQQVRGVTLNFKHKELVVSDKRLNGVLTYHFPEIFQEVVGGLFGRV